MYAVKEIYYTLQGEGQQAGRAAVFLRFAGCNLWNGLEEGRASAVCKFCDTDFVGTDGENGGKFSTATELARVVDKVWSEGAGPGSKLDTRPLVVITGGEPALQLDDDLVDALHEESFEVAVESNGTRVLRAAVDWLCVSPKADAAVMQDWGDELKLVYPQDENDPADFIHLDFTHFYLQPKDGPDAEENLRRTIEYCLKNPPWRLCLQTHKLVGLK